MSIFPFLSRGGPRPSLWRPPSVSNPHPIWHFVLLPHIRWQINRKKCIYIYITGILDYRNLDLIDVCITRLIKSRWFPTPYFARKSREYFMEISCFDCFTSSQVKNLYEIHTKFVWETHEPLFRVCSNVLETVVA